MTTQLDFEKRKKRTSHSDVKAVESQAFFPPILEERPNDLICDQKFCVFCGRFHKPSAKLRCALNRAITKIGSKTVSGKRKNGKGWV
jgi:hypothetical protein